MAVKHTFLSWDYANKKNVLVTKNLTGMSAIKEKCMECCGWDRNEMKGCTAESCALHPFRFGKYPK